jgi:hypothetical protein
MADHNAGPTVRQFFKKYARNSSALRIKNGNPTRETTMKLQEKIQEKGATGYILLWLLGVPIPVLFLFFLLRGCT